MNPIEEKINSLINTDRCYEDCSGEEYEIAKTFSIIMANKQLQNFFLKLNINQIQRILLNKNLEIRPQSNEFIDLFHILQRKDGIAFEIVLSSLIKKLDIISYIDIQKNKDIQQQLSSFNSPFNDHFAQTFDYINQQNSILKSDFENALKEKQETIDNSNKEKEQQQRQIVALTSFLSEIKTDITNYQNEYKTNISSMATNIEKQNKIKDDQNNEIKTNINNIQSQLNCLKNEIDVKLTAIKNENSKQNSDVGNQINSLKTDITSLGSKTNELKSYIDQQRVILNSNVEKIMREKQEFIDGLITEKEKQQKQIAEIISFLNEMKKDLSNYQIEYKSNLSSITTNIEKQDKIKDEIKTNMNNIQTMINSQKNEIEAKLNAIKIDNVAQKSAFGRQNSTLQADITSLRKCNDDLKISLSKEIKRIDSQLLYPLDPELLRKIWK